MMFRTIILASAIVPFWSVSALAQGDQMHMLYLAAANQLGVIEYCQSQGFVDSATVDAQKKIQTALPAATDTTGIDDAESVGKQGTILANGNKVTLAQAASSKGTTIQAICGQIGSTVKMAANNMQNMPTTPGGTSMPSGMPTPGTMPNMPAMPGAPTHQ